MGSDTDGHGDLSRDGTAILGSINLLTQCEQWSTFRRLVPIRHTTYLLRGRANAYSLIGF